MNKFKFISSLIISILGCLIQCYFITINYLSYATVTQVIISRPAEIIAPDTLYCTHSKISSKIQPTKVGDLFNQTLLFEQKVHRWHIQIGRSSAGKQFDFLNSFKVERLIKEDSYCT